MKNLSKKGVTALILIALMTAPVGCASNVKTVDINDNTENTAPVSTAAPDSGDENTTPADSDTSPETTSENPRNVYTIPPEESSAFAEENEMIEFAGFNATFFSSSINGEAEFAFAMPMFSIDGLRQFMEDHPAFDYGSGEGSFREAIESYPDEFFNDKGILVISFRDDEGGSNYKITGAWEKELVNDTHKFSQLVISVRKEHGDTKAGLLLVELDKNFLNSWQSYSIELYEKGE